MKKTSFEFDFSTLAIKGRGVRGNIISKHAIKNIVQREEGVSTLGALDIWYDDTVRRLNTEERGEYLGAFKADDRLFILMSNGEFKLTSYDLNTHFDDEMAHLSKYDPELIISAVYFDGEMEKYYAKRFQVSEHSAIDKKYQFIPESKGSKLVSFSTDNLPRIEIEIKSKKGNEIEYEVIPLAEFIGTKSYRAKGKRLTTKDVQKVKLIDPLPDESSETTSEEDPVSRADEDKIQEQEQVSTDTVEDVEMEVKDSAPQKPASENDPDKPQKVPSKAKKTKSSKKKTGSKEKPGEDEDSQLELEF
jgi:topoisomerase-4 subunit A